MPCHVWYSRDGGDERPWLVRRHDGQVTRARVVRLQGLVTTAFARDGFSGLQPGGPRGVVVCDDVRCEDEEAVGA